MARLEVRTCISPGPSWFNKVRLIAASIREFYPDATFTVSVTWDHTGGGMRPAAQPHPKIAGVTWRDVPKADFMEWKDSRSPYLATMMDRYKPPFHGNHILFLDADVICMNAFNYLFVNPGISGVMAHVPPLSAKDWAQLLWRFGAHTFSLDKEYSGWGTMVTNPADRFGPTYFNSGVVFGPKAVFEKLYEPYFEAIDFLRKTLADTYWFDQLGLALAIAKAEIPATVLPLRYNFPNQKEFDECHPDELGDVRFLHYLRTNIIDRDRDLMSKDAMERLITRRDLQGSNELFRARVEKLLPCLS